MRRHNNHLMPEVPESLRPDRTYRCYAGWFRWVVVTPELDFHWAIRATVPKGQGEVNELRRANL
jgi:hypothetical protein